jgi:hypothetical protein
MAAWAGRQAELDVSYSDQPGRALIAESAVLVLAAHVGT